MISKKLLAPLFLVLFSLSFAIAGNNPQKTKSANLTVYSYGINGSPTLEYGQSGNIELVIQNTGTSVATNISATLTTNNTYVVSLTDNENVNLGSVTANGGVAVVSNKFLVELSDDVPDMQNINFTLELYADDTKQTWTYQISITAHAPNISIGTIQIANDDNTNAILDAGENADLIIQTTNVGHASIDAEALLEIVGGSSPYLTIYTAQHSIGTLEPNVPVSVTFSVTASIDAPLETPVDLELSILAGNYTETKDFEIIIGYIPEFTMTNSTEYICYGIFFDSGGENGDYSSSENYTMTFYPANPSKKLQVTFSEYETESSYDYLYIYNGTNSSAPQLAEMNGYLTSPGTYQATNTEGALTFVFSSDGSVTDPGWQAVIECYDNTLPPNCATLTFPDDNATGIPPSVTLEWLNTASAESYDVYIGEILPETPTDNTTNNQYSTTLEPNTTYEWKVIPKNENGEATGCQVRTFTTGGTVYNMSNTTITTCSATLYDSGGPEGDYSSSEFYTMTIMPETTTAKIIITFNSFETESGYDELTIYDGTSSSATTLATLTGSETTPISYTATNAEGAITLVFDSDGSVTDPGWEATVECFNNDEAPSCTGGEYPEDGYIGFYPVGTLSWDAVTTATSYDVYIGETLPSTPTANVTTTSYQPTLSMGTSYEWKIVPKNEAGEAESCDVWTFSTAGQIVLMQNAEIITCNAIFFDAGGYDNEYTSNEDYILTLYPEIEDDALQIEFTQEFSTESGYDYLEIRDGEDETAPLIVSLTGSQTISEIYSATNPAGALTFVFHSDGSSTTNGWEALVTCINNPVGVRDTGDNITIYPNPSNGKFMLKTDLENYQIEIYNITGELIDKKELSLTQNFDISNEPAGVYFIKISTGETSSTHKIILQ